MRSPVHAYIAQHTCSSLALTRPLPHPLAPPCTHLHGRALSSCTTGNMPNVLESTSFTGESVFHGGATFLDQDVVLGTRDGASNAHGGATLQLNAVLKGCSPLHFEVCVCVCARVYAQAPVHVWRV